MFDHADLSQRSVAGGDRLRIAVYMQDLAGGGSERVNVTLAREWQQLGHEVTLLLHEKAGDLVDLLPPDLKVVSFETSRVLADIPKLVRYLRVHKPDVLIASLEHNNVAAMVAKAIAVSRTRVIICQHNPFSTEAAGVRRGFTYRLMPSLYRLLGPLASGVVAVSQGVALDVAAVTGIPLKRITPIYNPVVTRDFDALADEPVEHPWMRDGEPRFFVSAGRLVAQKNHQMLVRAFAAHVHRGADSRLVILGSGPERERLMALAVELGVGDRFGLPGFIDNPLPFIRRAAAFVLTSRYEGFGNVLVEAMGVGTPVISVDCPHGPAEILDGGQYGLLTPVDDIDALSRALDIDTKRRWPAEVLRCRAAAFRAQTIADAYLALMAPSAGLCPESFAHAEGATA